MHDVPEDFVALAPDYDFVDLPRLVADGGGACLALKGLRVGIRICSGGGSISWLWQGHEDESLPDRRNRLSCQISIYALWNE